MPNQALNGHFTAIQLHSINWEGVAGASTLVSFDKKNMILKLDFEDDHEDMFNGRECCINLK